MPDDMKLDPKALEAAYRAWPEVADRKDDRADFEFAISAYLSALPSLPSDIDGLVEELEAVTAAVLYTCADCEEGGNYEGMCHAADNCVLLDGRVLCEDCYSDGHYPKGAPRIPDIKKSLDRLIAALRARQAPEGVVETLSEVQIETAFEDAAKAAFTLAQSVYRADHDHFPLKQSWETTSEAIREGWRKIAHGAVEAALMPPLGTKPEPRLSRERGPRAALSAMPSGAVKVKELQWPVGEPRTRLTCKPTGPYCYTIVRAGEGVYRWACTDVWVRADAAPAGHNPNGRWSDVFPTLDAAKAAAQADYDTRIRSALEGQPS